ncbi:cation diffusion facilitator family transporter [Streptomyces massasporeus]|uniref:cation diffusion facilitator family transporter n=1 Tax=Streptomyces massasporeus TaxID=67324 RepID=UPI0033EE2C07
MPYVDPGERVPRFPPTARCEHRRPGQSAWVTDEGSDRRTRVTVLVALAANLVIAVAKAIGGLAAGSPALLSEAAHSVADSLNEVFLLAALRRSRRPADRRHPFGYGKERFFWSLLAAVGIFVMGGCFSFFQGFEALASGAKEELGGSGKAAVARELGCDVVIDRRSEDVVAAVKEATGGRGADVIYDPVGGEAYAQSAKVVAFEGRIVVVGFASGTIPSPGLNHALVKNYSILGLHWGLYNTKNPKLVQHCHEQLTELAARGAIKPLVSERVPLGGAAAAVQKVADGLTTGRIAVVLEEAA